MIIGLNTSSILKYLNPYPPPIESFREIASNKYPYILVGASLPRRKTVSASTVNNSQETCFHQEK